VNVQPYILQQALEARHADLVRQADAGRLASRASRRRRLPFAAFRGWLAGSPSFRPGRGALRPQA
jgi:hypothetical protein